MQAKNKFILLILVYIILFTSCNKRNKTILFEDINVEAWNTSLFEKLDEICPTSKINCEAVPGFGTPNGKILRTLNEQLNYRIRFRNNLVSFILRNEDLKTIMSQSIEILEIYGRDKPRFYVFFSETNCSRFEIISENKIDFSKMSYEKIESIKELYLKKKFNNCKILSECAIDHLFVFSKILKQDSLLKYKTKNIDLLGLSFQLEPPSLVPPVPKSK